MCCLHENAHEGYDFVVLTDISQCFESWHRASAGEPNPDLELNRRSSKFDISPIMNSLSIPNSNLNSNPHFSPNPNTYP